MSPLPSSSSSSAYVEVSILPAGRLGIPDYIFHEGGSKDIIDCPVWAFYIHHLGLGKKAWFDLGIHHDLSIYPPKAQDLFKMFEPFPPKESLASRIQSKKGVSSDQINQVIFSHVHWDHCAIFSKDFPNATAVVGPGSIDGSGPGYPTVEDTTYFSELLDRNHPFSKNVSELPAPSDPGWKPFGPFERAWDLWGDGSFWLLDTPGHVDGNIAGAARLKNGEWIVMGGDCAHTTYNPRVLSGHPFGTWKDREGKELCMHADKEAAKDTIKRMRELSEMEGVHLALAHVPLEERNDPFLKSLLLE